MAAQRCGARNRNNPNNDNNNTGFRVALSTFVAPVPELPGGWPVGRLPGRGTAMRNGAPCSLPRRSRPDK